MVFLCPSGRVAGGGVSRGLKPRAWSLDISKDGFRAEAKVLARNLVDAAEVHAGKPQLDLSKASAVECILSRRDSMIVARHDVPGKASLQRAVP